MDRRTLSLCIALGPSLLATVARAEDAPAGAPVFETVVTAPVVPDVWGGEDPAASSSAITDQRTPRAAERSTLVCTAIWYLILLVFGQLQHLTAGLLTLFLAGFVQNVAMIAMTAVLLGAAGEGFRGRVMGVRMLAVYGLPLGLIGAGVLIERIGYPLTITTAASV